MCLTGGGLGMGQLDSSLCSATHTHMLPPRYLRGVKILLLPRSLKKWYKRDTILQFYMLGNVFQSHFALHLGLCFSLPPCFKLLSIKTETAQTLQTISITFMLSDVRQRSRNTFTKGFTYTLSLLSSVSLPLSSLPPTVFFLQSILFQQTYTFSPWLQHI